MLVVLRQKNKAHAVFADVRQLNADTAAGVLQELMRQLHQNAGAVARCRVATAGTAMGEVDQNLERFFDDAVGFLAFQITDEADPTGVVFVGWRVQALWRGKMLIFHDLFALTLFLGGKKNQGV